MARPAATGVEARVEEAVTRAEEIGEITEIGEIGEIGEMTTDSAEVSLHPKP